jgi:diguanylate cyclase (GGDEF)-like protein
VRAAFVATVGAALVCLLTFRMIGRQKGANRTAGTARRWKVAFGASSWLLSVSFASTYVASANAVSANQLLLLTVVATAICAVAILSAATSLFAYFGFVTIHMISLAVAIEVHPQLDLVPAAPVVIVFLTAALTIIARENIKAVHEKIALAMKVREFGLRDALTGLRNRAFVELFTDQRASQIIGQWSSSSHVERRNGAPRTSLALLIIDIDHFKKINDRHGHASGDQVLATFAKLAQSAVRTGDIVARWGGEEFLVVMEVEDREAAHVVAERLRMTVASTPVTDASGRAMAVTCSIGATLFPLDPRRPDELTWRETLELADGALYRAKSSGRNGTAWAKPDPEFSPRQLLEQERESDAETLTFRKAA